MKNRGLNLIWLVFLFVLVTGCRGCNQSSTSAQKKEEEERKKQRLVVSRFASLPSNADLAVSSVKPGHWYQANARLIANQQDESLSATLSVLNRQQKPVGVFPGLGPMEFRRNVSIVRGKEKELSLTFFQPDVVASKQEQPDLTTDANPANLRIRYTARGVGTPLLQDEYPLRLMNGYEYQIVSISVDPARYSFLRALDCMSWSSQVKMPDERTTPHRVVDLKEDEIATQLPNRLYAMTSTSHFVVNDASPSLLSPEQQESLIDWLHFGGTIVINGVDAVGGTTSSFLKEYLPLVNCRSGNWSERDTALLNQRWSVPRATETEAQLFAPPRIFPKLEGELAPQARWIDTLDGLVAERIIGQGRIVMTTFPMNEIAFTRWPSYSSLVHNAILRKPPREVRKDPKTVNDYDTLFAGPFAGTELNPIHSTRLRLWARDLDLTTATEPSNKETNRQQASPFPSSKKTSVAAWNPQSDVLLAARGSLQESSGITVPKVRTIIMLLLGYLTVLVPLNWLVFRLMGRVELAWVAAPFIAMVGAFAVAKSVQLDVGFSRSQTTYGFLECHSGYPRGLLTNYSALYTSLSTNYRAMYDQETGVVCPMPTANTESSRKRLSIPSYEYSYAGDEGAGLRNSPVLSNTTGLLHSEEMVGIGGAFSAELSEDGLSVSLKCDSACPVRDVGILGVDAQGRLIKGWLGTPERGSQVTCNLETPTETERWFEQWDQNPSLQKPDLVRGDGTRWTSNKLDNDLYLGHILESVTERYPLGLGEVIAIGWTDEPISKLKISPETTQTKQKSIVLLHVKAASLAPARPDAAIFPLIKLDEEPEAEIEVRNPKGQPKS